MILLWKKHFSNGNRSGNEYNELFTPADAKIVSPKTKTGKQSYSFSTTTKNINKIPKV